MTLWCQNCCAIIILVKKLGVQLIKLLLTVVILLLMPVIILVITLPFGTFRYLLHKSAKCFRPDLSKMVTLRGHAYTIDTFYTKPQANVIIQQIFEGKLNIDELKHKMARDVLETKFSNGEIKYPELKQYLTSWMGYFFWKDDESFDLSRHVTVLQDGLSDTEIPEVYNTLVHKPWDRDRPLWEISVVPNYYPKGRGIITPPQSLVFVRYHHALSDGFSMFQLITEGLCDQKAVPPNAVATYAVTNCFQSMMFWLTFPFRSSYELADVAVHSHSLDIPFKPSKKYQTGRFHFGVTDKIPIKRIKDVKNHFGVSFASVVCAVCTGALQDMMIIKGIKIPDVLPCGVVLPVRGHPVKLRNYLSVGMTQMCTAEPDPVKRLLLTSKDYQRLRRSAGPVLATYLPLIVGSLPACAIRALNENSPTPIGITSFPGGFEHMSFVGNKCIDVIGIGGLPSCSLGICFFALSYVDGLRISAVVNESVMTDAEVNEVAHLLQRHVDILHEQIVKDV